jgi:methionyl-tRNA formyltransferase
MRFIFFGSSEFAKIVLNKLLGSDMRPVLVVTTPPKPKGRKKILSPTPVHNLAEQNNIPVLFPENLEDKEFLANLKNYDPDLVILTAYGKIIPSQLLLIPKKGFLNLHPSLLPRWRGAIPIQSVILNGDKETGVTLFLMDEQIDHGPTLKNKKLNIKNKKYTYPELSKELAELGAELIIETVPKWLEGKIKPIPQDDSLATYCHKISSEDEKINWEKSSIEIDRKVRALNPKPGVFTIANDIIIKIIKGCPIDDPTLYIDKPVGSIFQFQDKLAVKCGKGIYIIEELKPAGKNTMNSESFLRGNKWILEIKLL